MFFGYWIKFLLIFYINTKIINWCKSLRLEVLIRIIALLQRKTLIETKNCTLKCLKRHYSSVRSMKNVAVLTEDGAFALFFRPHPGGFDSSRVPTPRNLPSKAKKMLMPGGQDAAENQGPAIIWCESWYPSFQIPSWISLLRWAFIAGLVGIVYFAGRDELIKKSRVNCFWAWFYDVLVFLWNFTLEWRKLSL